MAKTKINWLLILQGWAMLWVVIGHSPLGEPETGPEWENILYHFAYSFHMPLFMLVSGWLFYRTRFGVKDSGGGGKKWTYPAIVKDKALRLLLPGLVFSVVALVLKVFFPGEMSRQVGLNMNDIIHSYIYPYDNPFREIWFIVTLFWLFLMTPVWKLTLKKDSIMWGTVLLLIGFHVWNPKVEFLCIGTIFNYAIWFYLGLVISKTNAVELLFMKSVPITFLVGVAVYVLGLYTNEFLVKSGGIVFSFAIALAADKYIPKLFISFRNYTYQIFLMGIFSQIGLKILYRHIAMPYMLAFLLCVAVGLYVPVFISKVAERINWIPLLMCMGLKKK